MASEKQIAANRANAERSTGPKTLAGKIKSCRNAFQHGLSNGLPPDPAFTARLDAMANALVGDGATDEKLLAATEVAKAQLELLRIRAERNRMMATVDLQFCRPRGPLADGGIGPIRALRAYQAETSLP